MKNWGRCFHRLSNDNVWNTLECLYSTLFGLNCELVIDSKYLHSKQFDIFFILLLVLFVYEFTFLHLAVSLAYLPIGRSLLFINFLSLEATSVQKSNFSLFSKFFLFLTHFYYPRKGQVFGSIKSFWGFINYIETNIFISNRNKRNSYCLNIQDFVDRN